MPIPSKEELMLPTVTALGILGGSATVEEMTGEVAEILQLSEEERNEFMPGRNITRLKYRLTWSRNYLKHGGLIVNSRRGVWALTPRGEDVSLMTNNDIQSVIDSVLNERRAQTEAAAPRKTEEEAPDADEEEASDADGENDWKQQLLTTLLQMESYAFERLCQRLLRESGFESVEVTKRSGDGGIDGFGVLQVNLVTFRVVFECKRHSNNVGAPIIQAFRGAMDGRGEKGLVITTASFTSDARKEAARLGALSIDLVDGDRLCDLLKNLGLGVSTEMVERVNIDREWFLRV